MTKPEELPDAKYPIRVVARMTGLPIDTLRAWERRHAGVTPARDRRGRMYSDADVERLRLLRDAVANGHAIGRVARLDLTALRDLGVAAAEAEVHQPAPVARGHVVSAPAIISALEELDLPQVELLLARAAALLSVTALLRDIIMPAMREVGERWHARTLGLAQEHLLSGVVRNLLGSLIRVHASPGPSRILFATPSGERHEFGALGGVLIAASGGLGATYLGPDLPAGDLVEMAIVSGSEIVVLGVTLQEDGGVRALAEVAAVMAGLPPHVELWIGGPAANFVVAALGSRLVAIPDYEALEAQLTRVGGKF